MRSFLLLAPPRLLPVNVRGAAPCARFDSASGFGTSCLLRWRRIHLRCPASRHLEPLVRSSVGAPTCRGRSAGVHCGFKGWLGPQPLLLLVLRLPLASCSGAWAQPWPASWPVHALRTPRCGRPGGDMLLALERRTPRSLHGASAQVPWRCPGTLGRSLPTFQPALWPGRTGGYRGPQRWLHDPATAG